MHMTIKITTFILLLLVCVFTGCDLLSSDNQTPIHIKTDKNQYSLAKDDSIQVTIINTSFKTIHYTTCYPKSVEMLRENVIVKKFGFPICYCICPAELKPGEKMPTNISGVALKQRFLNSDSDEDVSYRIRYFFYFDEAFGDDPVSPEYSRSNTFSITGIEQ